MEKEERDYSGLLKLVLALNVPLTLFSYSPPKMGLGALLTSYIGYYIGLIGLPALIGGTVALVVFIGQMLGWADRDKPSPFKSVFIGAWFLVAFFFVLAMVLGSDRELR